LISLVGMPGSGESTVGLRTAKHLGLTFVDTDQRIEQRIGSGVGDPPLGLRYGGSGRGDDRIKLLGCGN
jgi:adenylate kinase family enzyme